MGLICVAWRDLQLCGFTLPRVLASGAYPWPAMQRRVDWINTAQGVPFPSRIPKIHNVCHEPKYICCEIIKFFFLFLHSFIIPVVTDLCFNNVIQVH